MQVETPVDNTDPLSYITPRFVGSRAFSIITGVNTSAHCVQYIVLRYDKIMQVEAAGNKKLSYCWETVRRDSMPRIAEMDVKMTT